MYLLRRRDIEYNRVTYTSSGNVLLSFFVVRLTHYNPFETEHWQIHIMRYSLPLNFLCPFFLIIIIKYDYYL